jgi:hypothetical protein
MKFSGKFASAAIFAAFGVAAMAVADIGPFSSIGQFARTSQIIGQATSVQLPTARPTLHLHLPGTANSALHQTGDIPVLSRNAVLAVVDVPGDTSVLKCQILVTNHAAPIAEFDFTARNGSHEIDLSNYENGVPVTLKAVFLKKDSRGNYGRIGETEAITFKIDTEGPQISDVRLASDPSSNPVNLDIRFREDNMPTVDLTDGEAQRRYKVTNVTTNADVQPTAQHRTVGRSHLLCLVRSRLENTRSRL